MINARLLLSMKTSLTGRLLSALPIFVLLFSLASQAAEYRFQSSIALMAESDDNVRLQAKDGDIYSLQGESAILNADFSRNQANRSLSINGRFAGRQYDLNRYNSKDVSVTANYQRSFERGSLSLNLSASDESIRSLENQLENEGSTEQKATKATSYSLAISGQRQLTERQFLQNQFSVQQRDYDSDNRSSYDYFSNSLLWVYSINSALSLQANLSLSSFRPEKTDGIEFAFIEIARNDYSLDDPSIFNRMVFCTDNLDPLDPYNSDTALAITAPIPNFQPPYTGIACFNGRSFSLEQDTINLQLGLQYQWTENLTVNLLIGSSYSETEQDRFSPYAFAVTGQLTGNYIEEREQDNLSFNVDMDYQHSARVSTSLKASQSQEQTAYGLSVDTRRVSLSNKWKINEINTLKVYLSKVDRDQSLTESNETLYSDNISKLNISHIKYWHNNLRSNLSYTYSNLDKGVPGSRERDRWILTLTWQPEALSWSK